METKPRRPADCDLDYGGAFEMNAKGPAARLCHGDTVMDKALPVLGYGEVWQRGGFTCTSEQAGVTCFNTDRRGFSLARAKQEVFYGELESTHGAYSAKAEYPVRRGFSALSQLALEYWIPRFRGR